MGTFPKVYEYLDKEIFWIGMRRMLCFYSTCLFYTRVIQKDRVYPILNSWFNDVLRMKTVVEDQRSSHRLDDYLCLDWAVHPRQGNKWWLSRCTWRSMGMQGPLSCIGHMGQRIRCLRFRSDPERTCEWICVWHWILFCIDRFLLNIYLFGGGEFILLLNALLWDVRPQRLYINRYQSHGVNCLCGMLRCKWSRLLLKRRILRLMIKAQL